VFGFLPTNDFSSSMRPPASRLVRRLEKLLVDAALIRMVVVPAAMTLLGKWNWYLPSWLNWLPELHVEDDPDALHPTPPPVLTSETLPGG
jgi:hypothetical protein